MSCRLQWRLQAFTWWALTRLCVILKTGGVNYCSVKSNFQISQIAGYYSPRRTLRARHAHFSARLWSGRMP